MKIIVINGPNINMLGQREPMIYGNETLSGINEIISNEAKQKGVEIDFFQSNNEGDIISKIHLCKGCYDGIIINAGALSHYSYSIRDAISTAGVTTVEVHILNVYAREVFRHKSVLSAVCQGVLSGFGIKSYLMALYFFAGVNP